MATPTPGLEPLRSLTWPEVFGFWRENEAGNADWQRLARERGFDDWEDWRSSYVPPFRLTERAWTLHRVTNPAASVPAFRGGPFLGWIEHAYAEGERTPTFARIAERRQGIKNERVLSLLAAFPAKTILTGVRTDEGVVILEGMHRCAALAVAAAQGRPIETELTIALGSALPGRLPIVGGHRKGESPIRG